MNKDIFNKLEIVEQVKYINVEILKGRTTSDILKSELKGLAGSTLTSRLTRNGYSRNKIDNTYINIAKGVILNTTLENNTNTNTITDNNTITNTTNNTNTNTITDNNTITNTTNNTNTNTITDNNTITDTLTSEEIKQIRNLLASRGEPVIKIKYNDIQAKTMFISKKVYKEFKEFCLKRNLQMKDIVSNILTDYMKNN